MATIFLSVPILGKPELNMIYSMYKSILSCTNHQVRVYFNENDSLISRVRNVHMSVFLEKFPECDYFMSIDSDLNILNSYSTNNIFSKLIAHDLDFVGGLYGIKKPGVRRCSSIFMDGTKEIDFDSGLKEMRWLSSGCWCVKREAAQRMADAYPELIYDGDDNAHGQEIHGLYIPYIYEMTKEEFPEIKGDKPFKKYLSEDWSFCDRWKKIGGKIYADTSIALEHIGKFPYTLWNIEVRGAEGGPPVEGYAPEDHQPPPPPGYELEK